MYQQLSQESRCKKKIKKEEANFKTMYQILKKLFKKPWQGIFVWED